MKLVELLNRVNAVYEDGYLGNYYDPQTGARTEGSGDTLAEFIVIELSETFDAEATGETQLEEAARALTSAKDQLEECIAALQSTRRIIATFRPQGWQNDCAIDLDPEGPTTFDVTDAVLAMGREKALALEDHQSETDALRYMPNAPKWIRNWGGPFEVEVSESVHNFFKEAKS